MSEPWKVTTRYRVGVQVDYNFGGSYHSTLEAPTMIELEKAVKAFRQRVIKDKQSWQYASKVSFGKIVYETETRQIPVRFRSRSFRKGKGFRRRGV